MSSTSSSNSSQSNGPYTITPLGCGAAGTQSVVAVAGSSVAFASLAATSTLQSCTITVLGQMATSNVAVWNVCYAAGSAGNYTSQVVASQPYLGPTGVGLAFDPSGSPTLAFTGVGSTPAMEACGSNDLFVTTLQGSAFGTPVQVSNGSTVDGFVGTQYMGGAGCPEGVCDTGDTAGFWPAVAFDPGGTSFMPYRDVHFGFGLDDFAKSSVDLAEGSGGSYQLLQIDVGMGGGQYNRIALSPAGLPSVLQYNQKGASPGLYLDSQVMAGSFVAQQAAGVWTSQQIFTGQVDEQLGFAISASGLFAAAYYDLGSSSLLYIESMDGTTWSTPVPVDTNGNTGFYPSLAFDANGDPAIAYYRCNGQSAGVGACDPATDGLYLARRSGTAWTPAVVQADPSVTDGLYPALAFVNGSAVIAFEEMSSTDLTSATWWVAEAP